MSRQESWHTSVIAALAARSLGFGRSAFGIGGGRAAVCGDEASADKSFADGGVFVGMATGGVSPRAGLLEELDTTGAGLGGCATADIIACRWYTKREVDANWEERSRAVLCARSDSADIVLRCCSRSM